MTMKTEHKYAQVLRWIADGKKVEGRTAGTMNEWCDVTDWNDTALSATVRGEWDYEFRLKPRTITVNGREIVAGETAAPELRSTYWSPWFSKDELVCVVRWSDDGVDKNFLKRGLVHLTKENAIAHAKAMLGID